MHLICPEKGGSGLGYLEWKDAIKLVARQRGVPHKFRKKVITLMQLVFKKQCKYYCDLPYKI